MLIALLRAVWRGQTIAVTEPAFGGEGTSRLGSPVAHEPYIPVPEPGAFIAQLMANEVGRVVLTSSGSEGVPTAVLHTMQTLSRAVVASQRHRDDVWGLAFNPGHIAGVQVFLQAFANGNTIVNLWGVEPAELFARCRRWGVTHLSATPTFYRLITVLETPLPVIRSVSVGGEPADERLIQHLHQIFPAARLHNVYASTEAGTLLASDGVEFVLRESESTRLRIDQGRLWIHRSMLGDFSGAAEWFDTGDLVEVTATDPIRFRIVGRLRSSINVGGEKVHPHEVESALTQHPAILAARVYGRRNSVTGELLAADMVANGETPTELELRMHLAQRLPAWKIPRLLRFVERLELTRSGKVRR